MEKKVLIQELADALASREHITKKKAEALVRTFFEIAEEALLSEHFVKIKGFGTFKMVEVSERESVNISTGERFQIGGHMKVSFTPDNYLKDLVNRPFAHFQTVVINDETDLEELESVADEPSPEVEMPVEEMPQPPAVEEEAPAAPVAAVEAETPVVEETPAEPLAEIISPDPEATPVAQETVEAETEEIPVEPEASQPVRLIPEPEPTEEELEPATETPESAPVVAEEEQPEAEEEQPTAEEEPLTAEEEQPEASEEETEAEEEQPEASEEETEAEEEEEPTRCAWWKTLLVCLVVFLLMLLSYFAGYYRLLCPCEFFSSFGAASAADTAAQVVAKDTLAVPVPTVAAEAATDSVGRPDAQPMPEKSESAAAQPAATPAPPQVPGLDKEAKRAATLAAAAKYKQVPEGRYLITGTKTTHTIKSGETLRIVAEKIYGSRGYAPYISVHNDITDPNLVEVGMVVKIPVLERVPQ